MTAYYTLPIASCDFFCQLHLKQMTSTHNNTVHKYAHELGLGLRKFRNLTPAPRWWFGAWSHDLMVLCEESADRLLWRPRMQCLNLPGVATEITHPQSPVNQREIGPDRPASPR